MLLIITFMLIDIYINIYSAWCWCSFWRQPQGVPAQHSRWQLSMRHTISLPARQAGRDSVLLLCPLHRHQMPQRTSSRACPPALCQISCCRSAICHPCIERDKLGVLPFINTSSESLCFRKPLSRPAASCQPMLHTCMTAEVSCSSSRFPSGWSILATGLCTNLADGRVSGDLQNPQISFMM